MDNVAWKDLTPCSPCKANLPIVIANALQVHKFAASTGQLAKTDKLNAKMIAHYGEALKPRLTEIKADNIQKISDLLVRRSQLVNMRTMEKNRDSIMGKEVKQTRGQVFPKQTRGQVFPKQTRGHKLGVRSFQATLFV